MHIHTYIYIHISQAMTRPPPRPSCPDSGLTEKKARAAGTNSCMCVSAP